MADEEAKRLEGRRQGAVRVTIEVDEQLVEGFDTRTVASATLGELVMLSTDASGKAIYDESPMFDPVLKAIEAMTREAINKTLAQVTTYETLLRADAGH